MGARPARDLTALVLAVWFLAAVPTDRGLGFYINNARAMADPVGLFTGVTLVTLLVLAIDAMLERLQARSLAWRPRARDVGVWRATWRRGASATAGDR